MWNLNPTLPQRARLHRLDRMHLNVRSVVISRNLIFVNNNNRTRLEVVEQTLSEVKFWLSDRTAGPGEVTTDSIDTTARDKSVGRRSHPGHTCSVTSSTPFGVLVIQSGAAASRMLPAPAGARGSGTAGQPLLADISAWPSPSTVSCTSDLLKQCVSYRFCLPALTSLFCSG